MNRPCADHKHQPASEFLMSGDLRVYCERCILEVTVPRWTFEESRNASAVGIRLLLNAERDWYIRELES